ncbi:MAG: hypothetical protein F6J98_19010 [Moorea sp. SIO4G2]|nr:hypothetical protein [Moorena sp. SIO4G2]
MARFLRIGTDKASGEQRYSCFLLLKDRWVKWSDGDISIIFDPTPDSRLPTPDSLLPTPYSLLPTPINLGPGTSPRY